MVYDVMGGNFMESYGIAAFRSRQAVLRFDDQMRRAGLITHIITTPRAMSMGCGLSVRFDRCAMPIAMELQRSHPSPSFIGFYIAQRQDDKVRVTPVRG